MDVTVKGAIDLTEIILKSTVKAMQLGKRCKTCNTKNIVNVRRTGLESKGQKIQNLTLSGAYGNILL